MLAFALKLQYCSQVNILEVISSITVDLMFWTIMELSSANVHDK